MSAQKVSDEEFVAAWNAGRGSPTAVSQITGLNIRGVYRRREQLIEKGVFLQTIPKANAGTEDTGWQEKGRAYKRQNEASIEDGNVIIFSDAHFWPGQPKSVAHEALLKLIKKLKPKIMIANGDIFDGARVSRHDPMGWADLPTVKEEIDICDEYLHEIRLAADPKQCDFYWNVGNHDMRFDKMLVRQASEYEGLIPRLEDRFENWEFAWSLLLNDSVMVKHRYHNGVHGAYNNTMKSGLSIVTGHLHRLLVTPWGDYRGRRWGVDTGTLSNPLSPQFDYGENNPTPHTSGFAALTFKEGMLLPPELCEVINGRAYFRGEEV
jgi:hypothetical protein